MTKSNYWVSPTGDDWKLHREGTDKATGIYPTQRKAEEAGRQILQNKGGGELVTQSPHGSIRSKDTINSKDPNPPKDKEH